MRVFEITMIALTLVTLLRAPTYMLITPDIINATFEFAASLAVLANVLKLHEDKQVRGINLKSIFFFWLWGVWNMYYYPGLGQSFSFYAGLFVMLFNTVWLVQSWYYLKQEKVNVR